MRISGLEVAIAQAAFPVGTNGIYYVAVFVTNPASAYSLEIGTR